MRIPIGVEKILLNVIFFITQICRDRTRINLIYCIFIIIICYQVNDQLLYIVHQKQILKRYIIINMKNIIMSFKHYKIKTLKLGVTVFRQNNPRPLSP